MIDPAPPKVSRNHVHDRRPCAVVPGSKVSLQGFLQKSLVEFCLSKKLLELLILNLQKENERPLGIDRDFLSPL